MSLHHWLTDLIADLRNQIFKPHRRSLRSGRIRGLSYLLQSNETLEDRILLSATFDIDNASSSLYAQDQIYYTNPVYGNSWQTILASSSATFSEGITEASWHGANGVYFAQATGSIVGSSSTFTLDEKARAEAQGSYMEGSPYSYYGSQSQSAFVVPLSATTPVTLSATSTYTQVESGSYGGYSRIVISGPTGLTYLLNNTGDGNEFTETVSLAPGNYTISVYSSASASIPGTTTGNYSVASVLHSVFNVVTEKSTPSMHLSVDNPNAEIHSPVTYTAYLSSIYGLGDQPTGSVDFYDGETYLGSGAIDSQTREAHFTTSSLSEGTHWITAKYQGDDSFLPTESGQVGVTIRAPHLEAWYIKIGADDRSIDYWFSLDSAPIHVATQVDFYYSSTPDLADCIGDPFKSVEIPAETQPQLFQDNITVLPSKTPGGAHYIVMVVDPHHTVDSESHTASVQIQSAIEIYNVITHGWRSSGSDFVDASNVMDKLPAPGSLLDSHVLSATPSWESTKDFTETVVLLAEADIERAFASTFALTDSARDVYYQAADRLEQLAIPYARRATDFAFSAARDIFQSLLPVLSTSSNPNLPSVFIQLIGHSRGAAVNAWLSKLISENGFSTPVEYVSLDGFSTDWPVVGPILGGISISDSANATTKRNYKVTDGLANYVGSLITNAVALGTSQPEAELAAPLLNLYLTAVLGDLRAPDRDGFLNVTAGDQFLVPTNHLNISDVYFSPGNFGLDPYQYYKDTFEGYLENAGLTPQRSLASFTQSIQSSEALDVFTESISSLQTRGFVDGRFDDVGTVFSQSQGVTIPDSGDDTLNYYNQILSDPAWILANLWDVTGDARLANVAGNSVARLTNDTGLASISQEVILPPHATTLTFDLGVLNGHAGDSLEILMNDSLIGSVPISSPASVHSVSIPLTANSEYSGKFTFRFSSATVTTADITLDNFAFQDNAQAPSLTVHHPVLPTLSALVDQTQNLGISVSDLAPGITSPFASDQLGIALTSADQNHGTFQYSLDGGVSWNLVPSVDATHALLLRFNGLTRLRLIPDDHFVGSINNLFSFKGWNATLTGDTAFSGDLIDSSNGGGRSPFSLLSDSASISITGVGLSGNSFSIGQPIGATFATINSLSEINGETFSYRFGDDGYPNDNGHFQITGTLLKSNFLFTQDHINSSNRIVIQAIGSLGTTFTRSFNFTAINVAPVLNPEGDPYLNPLTEGLGSEPSNVGTLVSEIISRMSPSGGISDPDTGALQGIAIFSYDSSYGTLQYRMADTDPWTNVSESVSQYSALLLPSDASTRVRYIPNSDFNGILPNAISFVAWDRTGGTLGSYEYIPPWTRGGSSSFSLTTETASITVRRTNTAPVLNPAGTPSFDSLVQNQSPTSNNGTLISDLISRMGPSGGITDVDAGALQGIAINGVSNTYGSWQYTVNGGTNWAPITTTGNSNALLLASDPNSRIRFIPNANFIGQSILAFVAWDRTSGANGGTANVSSRGGTKAFSLAYETATINVNNAAPVLNNAGAPTLDTIPMNVYGVNNTGTLVSDIIARMGPSGGITDPNPGALQGIAINGLGNTATGDWQYSINGGATWSLIGTTGNSNARLLAADPNTRIRYVPQVGYLGSAVFSFVAWDRTSGGNAAVVSVGTRGGTTSYSTDYDYASISIVNSAPVLNDVGSPLLNGILPNVPVASNPGTLVSDLIYRMYPAGGITDANPYALRGIAIIAKSGTGTWEFSTNNGTSWSTINSTSAANATLLSSDANTRVRYRPSSGFVGEAKIAFVAWDQSAGTNGSVVNASTRGGSTAFSTAYEYASIFVNTAPTLNIAGAPTLDPISNTMPANSNTGILVSTLISRMGPSGGITDPDPAALKGLAIIGQSGTATGSWQYSTNGGTSWSNITSTGSANALLLASDTTTRIRYVPNAGFTGTVAIAFAAWDRSQWAKGSIVNAGARGGATPFSLDYETATITITA